MRATICVDVDHEDECAAVEAWFDRWREQLTFISENGGGLQGEDRDLGPHAQPDGRVGGASARLT